MVSHQQRLRLADLDLHDVSSGAVRTRRPDAVGKSEERLKVQRNKVLGCRKPCEVTQRSATAISDSGLIEAVLQPAFGRRVVLPYRVRPMAFAVLVVSSC
jgi:hypothetical protein